MHEVALAQRMVDSLVATAGRHGGGRVVVARLRLGALTCVDAETLRFAFEVACRGTVADGCRLDVVGVPLRVRCRACGREDERAHAMEPCAGCGERTGEVLSGRELVLDTMDLE